MMNNNDTNETSQARAMAIAIMDNAINSAKKARAEFIEVLTSGGAGWTVASLIESRAAEIAALEEKAAWADECKAILEGTEETTFSQDVHKLVKFILRHQKNILRTAQWDQTSSNQIGNALNSKKLAARASFFEGVLDIIEGIEESGILDS